MDVMSGTAGTEHVGILMIRDSGSGLILEALELWVCGESGH